MRSPLRVLASVLVVVAAFAGLAAWLAWQLNDRPSFGPWAGLLLAPGESPTLNVTWLGVSTLLIDDGETAIMTDAFFSRPGLAQLLFTRIAPDEARIARQLEAAGVGELAAIVVVHSHYDHVMDAPEVARRTGALLIGSQSTAHVGLGHGLSAERIHVLGNTDTLRFGDFEITVIPSRHLPHGQAMGEIEAPLQPPARAWAYREGGSYSVLVRHSEASLLVQGSAGYVPGALDDYEADVVYLGLGGLGDYPEAYLEGYWREVVRAVDARRVVPVHWDDFTRPLSEPLRPFPRLLDDFDRSMRFLQERSGRDGVDLRLVPAGAAMHPLAQAPVQRENGTR